MPTPESSTDGTHASDNGHSQKDGRATGSSKRTKLCPSTGRPCDCTAGQVSSSSQDKQALADLKPAKAPQEPIFPAELRKRPALELHLPGPLTAWHRC